MSDAFISIVLDLLKSMKPYILPLNYGLKFNKNIQQKIAIIMNDAFISIALDLLKPMKPSILP